MEVKVEVNREKEVVTFSTNVTVDGRELTLSVTKLLYYQSAVTLLKPKFEDVFYWSLEAYTNPERNHNMYHRMVSTNYKNTSGELYEVQWS